MPPSKRTSSRNEPPSLGCGLFLSLVGALWFFGPLTGIISFAMIEIHGQIVESSTQCDTTNPSKCVSHYRVQPSAGGETYTYTTRGASGEMPHRLPNLSSIQKNKWELIYYVDGREVRNQSINNITYAMMTIAIFMMLIGLYIWLPQRRDLFSPRN
jgi:hypothetical protein